MPWVSEYAGAQIPRAGIPGENPRVLGADDIRCLPGIAVSPGSLVLPSGAVGCVSSVVTSGAQRGLCPRLQGPAPFGITSGEKQIGDGSRGSSKLDAFLSFFSRLDPLEG